MTSKTNPEATCGNCPFFSAMQPGLGLCKRTSPVASLGGQGVFPAVMVQEAACGEHPEFWQPLPVVPEAPAAETIPPGKTSMGSGKKHNELQQASLSFPQVHE